jgi:integrase
MEKGTEIEVFKPQDITIHSEKVIKQDIRKYWDRDYINMKIDQIANTEHRMLIQFLWMSGVRITEAVSLIKENIDFENYTLKLRWLKSRKYNYRIAPLHPRLRELLLLYTAPMKSDDRVFNITRQRAWQLVKKHLGGHPHQLRHSFAVNWLRCDGDIVTLHRILGHSQIQTTMEYLKIVPNDLGKELIKIRFE